ncbi:hypothetical protein ACG7TL_006092 [Trametes sanguinea]
MSSSRGAYNVPLALNPELSRTDGLHPDFAHIRLERHLVEYKRYTLGPMPVNSFLEELLPLPHHHTRGRMSSRSAFSGVPPDADCPVEVYVPLLQALTKRTKTKSRCPGFEFVGTYERSRRPTHPGYAKPYICCFTPENANIVRATNPRSRVEFAYAEFFIQMGSNPATDFFVDPLPEAIEATPGPATEGGTAPEFVRGIEDEDDFAEAEEVYGLHIAYATEVLARQHRLFLFSISLHGSIARFFRWDRSGCLVSEAFDIRQQPHLLTDFLWRFSQLPDAKRGLDATVQLASPHQEALFRDAVREHVRLQLEIEGDELEKAVTAHYLPGHVTVIPVTSRQSSAFEAIVHRFIVSRPVVSPLSVTGRGTRGFWAVDAATGQVVFLKDCWRFHVAAQVEGDVLRRLNDLGVRNVPVLMVHGDVPVTPPEAESTEPAVQSTLTQAFSGDSWTCPIWGNKVEVHGLWHYRLVTSTVGYALKNLRGTEELLSAGYDALIAMQDALTKASHIHRDVSASNIILVKEPGRTARRGYLIDWDASDGVDDTGESLQAGHAGTWLFMSMKMLKDKNANSKQTIADDMESLLYVVLYCALFYLPHNLSSEALAGFVEEFFEHVGVWYRGIPTGGDAKMANARLRVCTDSLHFESVAFEEWLQTVMDYHCPPMGSKEPPENMWTIDKLEAYWSRFLEGHALERDNCQAHQNAIDPPSASSSLLAFFPKPLIPLKRTWPDPDSTEEERASSHQFAYAELFFQVVSDPALDFFVDPPSEASEAKSGHDLLRKFEDHGALEEAELAYGLHIAYATEILARQHRLFLFSISLAGSFARFFRWDRAGCLVSEAFDVRQHPHLLTDFLWRFSQLSEAKRGLDTTVTLASPQEEVTFRDAITEEVRLQLDIAGDELEKAVSAHYLRGHVTIIPITPQQPSNSAENPHRFIVSRPIVSPLSLAGRGTRGFWAVDAHTGRVVFLKDCWRFYWAEEVEGDILRELNDLGVRNIPLLAVHGDVPMDPPVHCESELVSQSSFTDEFANDSWVCIVDGERVRVNEVWHYRLATFTVGYGLQTLRGTEELLYATHDALTAMKDAYTKDSRIHRDLSVGNIILVKEPDRVVRKGYLIDWEASDRVDDGGEALHAGRAGTWLFMSIRMLHRSQVNGKHTLADDLEALLYVVLYCALYYLPHNHSVEEVDGVRQQLFESYIRWPGGILHGGVGKLANAEDRLFTDHLHFESAALDEWLRTVMDFHCRRFGSKEGPENMWNIDKLDAFWIEFLETHALERDNRQVHTLPVDAPTDSSASSPYLLPPNPATQTKRRPSDTALDERSAPKALRLPAAAGVEPTTHTHQEPAVAVATEPAAPAGHSGSGVWNTPIAYTEDSSQRFGFDEKEAKPRYMRLAKQVLQTTLGPMPVDVFLDEFLSRKQILHDDMPPSTNAFDGVAQAISSRTSKKLNVREVDLYEPLIRALNMDSPESCRCPGYIFKDTSDHPDETHGKVGSTKPDVLCYATQRLTDADLSSDSIRARADMGFAETFIEVKLEDPLSDPSFSQDRTTWPFFLGGRKINIGGKAHDSSLENLGQSIAYGTEILARQHRCFCLSVMLAMTQARFARWDRTGVIVTEAFDIIEQPQYLCAFFWYFARLSETARGYDGSVQPALAEEERIFQDSILSHLAKQTALDVTSEQYLESNDIDAQATITQQYVTADWVSKGGRHGLRQTQIVHRIHYRLLLDVAGFDLLQIAHTDELLHSTHNAFEALIDAHSKCSRLHRDIHPGNIILYRKAPATTSARLEPRTGYLVDWESSCVIGDAPPEAGSAIHNYGPSLQWQFLSYDLASGKKSNHELVDDMESMIYVIIYCGMLRLRCKLAENHEFFRNILHNLFDIRMLAADNASRGGGEKWSDICHLDSTNQIGWTSDALREWVIGAYALRRSVFIQPDKSQWNPESLNKFWTSFFETNPQLPRDDRCMNVLEGEVFFSRVAPRIALGTILAPTTVPKMKRSGNLVIEKPKPAKRPRLSSQDKSERHSGVTLAIATASVTEEPGSSTWQPIGEGPRAAMRNGKKRRTNGPTAR